MVSLVLGQLAGRDGEVERLAKVLEFELALDAGAEQSPLLEPQRPWDATTCGENRWWSEFPSCGTSVLSARIRGWNPPPASVRMLAAIRARLNN